VGLGNPIHVVFLAVVLALWVGPSVLVGRLAERKGRSFRVYFIAALILGWWLVLIVALIIRPRRAA
jgi:Na+-driven multidrug efflux pump